MTELDEAKAREEFPTLLDRVVDGKERVVLTRHGKPVAVLVPAEDWAGTAAGAGRCRGSRSSSPT